MTIDERTTLAAKHEAVVAELDSTELERRLLLATRERLWDEIHRRNDNLRSAKVAKDASEFGGVPALQSRIAELLQRERELAAQISDIEDIRGRLLLKKETIEQSYRPRVTSDAA